MDLKRTRKTGDIHKLKLKVWRMILKAERIALDPDTDNVTALRAIHACVQAGASYLKILENTDLEDRIKKLEELYDERKKAS